MFPLFLQKISHRVILQMMTHLNFLTMNFATKSYWKVRHITRLRQSVPRKMAVLLSFSLKMSRYPLETRRYTISNVFIGRSKEGAMNAPPRPISFTFMQFSKKIWPNNRLVPLASWIRHWYWCRSSFLFLTISTSDLNIDPN